MQLIELSNNEFYEYTKNLKEVSIYQSLEYARFLNENGFDYNFLGIKDTFGNIIWGVDKGEKEKYLTYGKERAKNKATLTARDKI